MNRLTFLFILIAKYRAHRLLWCEKSLKARSHQRPDQPRSLPLWKNGRIGNERAFIGESVCWSKIQRGLVGPALRGRGKRDEFFNRLKNGRG